MPKYEKFPYEYNHYSIGISYYCLIQQASLHDFRRISKATVSLILKYLNKW